MNIKIKNKSVCCVAMLLVLLNSLTIEYRVLATWRQCGLRDVLLTSPSHLWIIFDGVFQTEHQCCDASNDIAAFLSFENRLMDPIREI